VGTVPCPLFDLTGFSPLSAEQFKTLQLRIHATRASAFVYADTDTKLRGIAMDYISPSVVAGIFVTSHFHRFTVSF
jgi:hypothetical protein